LIENFLKKLARKEKLDDTRRVQKGFRKGSGRVQEGSRKGSGRVQKGFRVKQKV
jgi:hypothetical protein